MITIILAAGNNKRFNGKHKAILPARNGKTIIENIVINLDADPVFIITQKKHRRKLWKIIKELSLLGKFRTVYHSWLAKPTAGPLDTLWQAREWIQRMLDAQNNGDCSVVISYCDVLLEHKYYREFLRACNEKDAGIVVFESDDERFGDAISGSYKNSGIFYFRSGKQMMIMLACNMLKGDTGGVPDLVYFSHDPALFVCNEVIDIGVPKDYEEYIND